MGADLRDRAYRWTPPPPGPFAVWEPRERCLRKHEEIDALGPCALDVLEVLVQIRLGCGEAGVDLGDTDP